MVFRTFWVFRCALHFFIFLSSSSSLEWDQETIQTLLKILLVRGCETLPSILGMAAIFSWITNKVLTLSCFVWSQCLFFFSSPTDIHALPTLSFDAQWWGIISCWSRIGGSLHYIGFSKWTERSEASGSYCSSSAQRLSINSLFPTFHSQCRRSRVDVSGRQVLTRLSSSYCQYCNNSFYSANPDIGRHFRALFVCGILTLVTASGLTFLWSYHYMSTWLLAVTGFSVEVISKVFISLALYGLFLADAKFNEFWDQLDDHVYRVRYFLLSIFHFTTL